MSISYTLPRLEGDQYARFVELALRYAPSWGIGYTSDGSALLFTAEHVVDGFGFACRDLEAFAALLDNADGCLRLLTHDAKADDPRRAPEREQAAHERLQVAALVDASLMRRVAHAAARSHPNAE